MCLTVSEGRDDDGRMAEHHKVAPEALLTAALTLIAILAMAAAAVAGEPLHLLPAMSTGVSVDRLDAVRAINDRKAMTASLKRQATPSEMRQLAVYTAKRPREVALAFRGAYGPDNFLTRGATAIATIIRITELGSRAPLDGVSSVAKGTGKSVVPRLRSRVTNKEIGIKLSSKW